MGAQANALNPEIAAIFADVFQYTGPLRPETSPDDIPKWDSLQHIALVRAIEETFSIALTMDEMMEIRCVQDVQNILDRHGI